MQIKFYFVFKSLFLPRVAEFIYIEGDNKWVSSVGIINVIYNENIVSRALSSSSVDYNWFDGINVWNLRFTCILLLILYFIYL